MNVAACLYGIKDLRLEQQTVPTPGEGEVLVSLKRCGVCGTDLHMWLKGGWQEAANGVVIGHETSGQVVAVGPGVTHLEPGDRVVPELGLPCSRCELCKAGRYNLCKGYSRGGFAHYLCYPETFCHKIPDQVSWDQGALVEPLAVAMRAIRRSGIRIGSNVLICGAGTLGLCCAIGAKFAGATNICITDTEQSKLVLAQQLGATSGVLVTGTPESVANEVRVTMGGAPEVVLECSGVESALTVAILSAKSGGVVTVVSIYANDDVTIPIVDATVREVDLRGVFSYVREDYQAAIAMVASGVDPTPLITHRLSLADVTSALGMLESRAPGVVKIMIDLDKAFDINTVSSEH